MLAIKSTGLGHGTILKNVGTTPDALLARLTSNPDFLLVSKPAPATRSRTRSRSSQPAADELRDAIMTPSPRCRAGVCHDQTPDLAGAS